jgi:hypothetical protein
MVWVVRGAGSAGVKALDEMKKKIVRKVRILFFMGK